MSVFALSCFVLFCCLLLESPSFLKRKQKGTGSWEERMGVGELEEVERRKTVVGMDCVRKESIFNEI